MRTYIAVLSFVVVMMSYGAAIAQPPQGAELVSAEPSVVVMSEGMCARPTTTVEAIVSGRTQLYIDWERPLTSAEKKFLATCPAGCDASGQSIRELIEAVFRAGIPHPESAHYYGWKDSNGVVYDYAYYCRLLQPADAPHTFTAKVRLEIPGLPPFVPAGIAAPVPATVLSKVKLPDVGIFTDITATSLGKVEVGKVSVDLDKVDQLCTNLITPFQASNLGEVEVSKVSVDLNRVEPLCTNLITSHEASTLEKIGEKMTITLSSITLPRPSVAAFTCQPAVATVPCVRETAGAYGFGRAGGNTETTIGGLFIVGDRRQECHPKEDDGTCGPPPAGGIPEPNPGEAGNTNPVTTIPVVDSPVVAPNPGVDPTAPELPVSTTPGQPGDIYNPPSEPTPGQPGAHPARFSF